MANNRVPILDNFQWQPPVLSNTADVPVSPSKGDSYLIPESATGVWATHHGDLAYYNGSGWTYIAKTEGLVVWVKSVDKIYVYTGSSWDFINKSSDNNFYFGDGGLNDMTINAQTNQAYSPKIRYNATSLAWEFSNGGAADNWVPLGGSGLFDIDMSGDLEPSSTGVVDNNYELDGNSDIQPKA